MNDSGAGPGELSPWTRADLPEPPMPRGLAWIGVCGPCVVGRSLLIEWLAKAR